MCLKPYVLKTSFYVFYLLLLLLLLLLFLLLFCLKNVLIAFSCYIFFYVVFMF